MRTYNYTGFFKSAEGHTYQLEVTGNIGGIYTTFKAGTKVSFFTTAKGDAICTEVVF